MRYIFTPPTWRPEPFPDVKDCTHTIVDFYRNETLSMNNFVACSNDQANQEGKFWLLFVASLVQNFANQ